MSNEFNEKHPAPAGIEGLTRYAEYVLENGGGIERAPKGEYVKFADVAHILAQAPVAEKPADEPLTIALGQGLIEIGQGHHGNDRAPALLFGRNGAGKVGVETQGDRVMEPGECIAAVTFENYQSLDVVVEKLGELRARIWPDAPHSQLSYGAAPHYRGYAHLGIGAYVLNHSAAGEPPELAISIATEAQKAGRVVGDTRDNEPGALVQPKDIAVRLRFENVAGLDVLEQQLRFVRSEHFADATPSPQAQAAVSEQTAAEIRRAALHEAEEIARCYDLGTPDGHAIADAIRHLATKEAAAAAAPSQWIKTAEQLPTIPEDGPSYAMSARVLGCFGYMVAPLRYARNMYAKTEKGRAPRWERWDGSLSSTPDAWMPLPEPPTQQKSAQRENGGDDA